MRKIVIIAGTAFAMTFVLVVLVLKNGDEVSRPLQQDEKSTPRMTESVPAKLLLDIPARSGRESASPRSDKSDDQTVDMTVAPQTAEEKREAEEEKRVNDFDGLTDKWMEPSPKGVSMADVDNFAKTFRKIPQARRDECIHRALNLIPDENVMLLAGVLMDKSIDKEIVETVYNDILNRSEDVKKPILQEIFKDKTHPCWADTAWILDVTGELPKKN